MQLDPARQARAVQRVLLRFLEGHVFATFEQIRDWSGLPTRLLRRALTALSSEGHIASLEVAGLGEGWMCAGERLAARPAGGGELAGSGTETAPATVFMLHRSDILVRAQNSALKRRFAGLEVLQYLLIDGAFQGAVVGHWRIGPHDVDDVVLLLPERERDIRCQEILAAVAQVYHPPRSRIVRYDGKPL